MLHKLHIKKLDLLGIGVSILCALHCLLLPFFLVFIGKTKADGVFHGFFDFAILLVAGFIMYASLKKHKDSKKYPLMIVLSCIGCVFFASSLFIASIFQHFLFVLGSLFWLAVHAINLKSYKH